MVFIISDWIKYKKLFFWEKNIWWRPYLGGRISLPLWLLSSVTSFWIMGELLLSLFGGRALFLSAVVTSARIVTSRDCWSRHGVAVEVPFFLACLMDGSVVCLAVVVVSVVCGFGISFRICNPTTTSYIIPRVFNLIAQSPQDGRCCKKNIKMD